MAGYTAVKPVTIQQILNLYGLKLDTGRPVHAMQHGISNSNYSLYASNKQKYLLKISNDKDKNQLLDEFSILEFLADNQYSYSISPMKTQAGDLAYEYKEISGALFPFKPGSSPSISKSSMYQLGMALGKLHQIPTNKTKIRSYFEVGQGVNQIFDYIYNHPDHYFSQQVLKVFSLKRLKELSQIDLPQGLLHGDFYFDNALFENNQIKWVLDFEQAGFGPLLLDIGIAISGSCLDSKVISIEFVDSYLEGYQSQRKLSQNENRSLNDFILLGFISISLWRIRRFVEKDISKEKTDSFKELLHMAIHSKEILCN